MLGMSEDSQDLVTLNLVDQQQVYVSYFFIHHQSETEGYKKCVEFAQVCFEEGYSVLHALNFSSLLI